MAEWLTLSAAASRLRWDLRKVESRARRERWQRRRGNRGRAMEYLVPDGVLAEPAESQAEQDAAADSVVSAELAEERAARARAEGELAAELRRSADLAATVAALRAELAETRKSALQRLVETWRRR